MKKDIDTIIKERVARIAEKRKVISDVMSDMASFFNQEDLKKSKDGINKICNFYINKCNRDDDYYMTQMSMICYLFNTVPAKPWLIGHDHDQLRKGDRFIIESIFNGLFSHWAYRMISVHEDNGGGSEADIEKFIKFITRRLLQAINVQENISLYEEYQAFWSYKYFKDTDQVRVEFMSWWMCEDMSESIK